MNEVRSFIISQDQIDGNKIRCSTSEQKHITTVLRMQHGDQVRFLDGNGNYYTAILQCIDEKSLFAQIINQGFNPQKLPSFFYLSTSNSAFHFYISTSSSSSI